nr:retrovirus-related Pol polyprotein from transposon TNT 1-94 [Tanacetum cinerariifolium]
MDESIPLDKKCQSSIEIFKTYVNTIINGVELCKEKIAYRTYSGYIDQFIQKMIEANFSPGYYYADHMNTILGVYTELDEVTNLQCDYLELLKKCEGLETELSNSKMMSKRFEALHKYAINLEIDLQQFTAQTLPPNKKSILKNMNVLAPGKLVQRGLQAYVRIVRTDKGKEFLNQNLHVYFAAEGIHHQMSIARTPEQNDVVERRNRTLVEAARTMLSTSKVPLFFWAEVIATACFTQNRSLVIPRHEKTPYHIINNRKPSVKFFHIFGSICYIVRDGKNLDKMK